MPPLMGYHWDINPDNILLLNTIDYNYIRSIVIDQHDVKWIGTSVGLVKLDAADDREIACIVEDQGGAIVAFRKAYHNLGEIESCSLKGLIHCDGRQCCHGAAGAAQGHGRNR